MSVSRDYAKQLDALVQRRDQANRYDWSRIARPEQKLPPGDWTVWLLMGGRGAGKNRTGCEMVRLWAKENPGCRWTV